MQVTKRYCDHCKKELDEMDDYIEKDFDIFYRSYYVDLCKDCVEKCTKLLDEFFNLDKGK